MHWIGWIIVIIAAQEAGWMAFDGTRALIAGDYVTPKTGQYAGQLGPWSKLVKALGIPPRSTGMKLFFAMYGFAWLAIIVCFAFKLSGTWWAMVIAACGSLWFLPFGTLCSVIQIILLMLPPVRNIASPQ